MKKLILSILAATLLCLSACREEKHGDPTPVTTNITTQSNARWIFASTAPTKPSSGVKNNELILSANADTAKYLTGASAFYAEMLKGDFEVHVTLDSLNGTGTSAQPEFSAELIDTANKSNAIPAVVNFSKGMVLAEIFNLPAADKYKYASAKTPLEIVYSRVGYKLTASVFDQSGTLLISIADPNFGLSDYLFNLFVADRGSLTGRASGYFSNVKITGGGVKYGGDDFSENRIYTLH